MGIFWFLVISYVLLSISLYFVFEKAGEAGWKGLVPGLNFVVWCKLIGRPSWWALLLLIPIVNIFIFCGMAVSMVRSFEKYRFKHTAAAVIYAPAIFAYVGLNDRESYKGPTLIHEKEYHAKIAELSKAGKMRQARKLIASNPYKKGPVREWVEAIVFAVFAAAFIRMFLIEAYTIPTPSMEGSLLVGDYLFVSKAHYGIRTPSTVIQIPLLHNRVPIFGGESYLKEPSLPYFRLPALEKIERNDPVVFNWPAGDEVFILPDRSYGVEQAKYAGNYQQLTRSNAKIVERPFDKTDFYIKRCIAIPGDTLQIIGGEVFINGEEAEDPEFLQFEYRVTSPTGLNRQLLLDIGVNLDAPQAQQGILNLHQEQIEALKAADPNISIQRANPRSQDPILFPHDPVNYPGWTVDNYGPVYIPKSGVTINISPENIAFYKRIITEYEGHDLRIKGNDIYIDGEQTDSYTFKWDYYWMMGDNRHASEDSRFWGFVPETHIVGKPLFIWMSAKNGIRWNRVFTSANR